MPAGARGQGVHRAGQEQLRPGHRVRRIRAGHVERAGQRGGQRIAEVVLDDLKGEAGVAQFAAQIAHQVGVAVKHGDAARPRGRVSMAREDRQCDADQVVVTEQQDPLPGQRARLVHGQHPAQLGVCGAVGLVQVQPCRGLAALRGFQRPGQLSYRIRDHHAQAAAARAAAGDPGLPRSRFRLPGQARPSLRGQPHRAGPVHHAALT